jgi:hypothetical protein
MYNGKPIEHLVLNLGGQITGAGISAVVLKEHPVRMREVSMG